MPSADPRTEARRLSALREYDILDTPPDGTFDRITALAARFFETPISLISLVDEDRIWFKSRYGVDDIDEVEREPGLCASVIMTDEAYVVENAIEDPRTLDNPLVAGEFGLRFYAAAPLITKGGHRLGTINVMDFEPRELEDDAREVLHDFADIVIDQMELRLAAREIVERLCRTFAESDDSEDAEEVVTVCAWTKRVRINGEWVSFENFLTETLGASVTHGVHPDIVAELAAEDDERFDD